VQQDAFKGTAKDSLWRRYVGWLCTVYCQLKTSFCI